MAFTHTPLPAKNAERVMKKIMAIITTAGAEVHEADEAVGGATRNRARKRVWVCTGDPSTTTVTGISLGDLCLDITNDDVFRRVIVAANASCWEELTA